MLVHKGGQFNNVQLITGGGLQRCHNYKIAVSCVQRMEVIVKMKKREVRGKGQEGCVQLMGVINLRKKIGEGGRSGEVRGPGCM